MHAVLSSPNTPTLQKLLITTKSWYGCVGGSGAGGGGVGNW